VCVLTVQAGLTDFGTSALPATPQKFKRFRSSKKGRKGESQQEVALHVLENYYWRLAFSICLADIPAEAKARAERLEMAKDDYADPVEDEKEGDTLSSALFPCFQPTSLRPAHLDSQILAEETNEREATLKSSLRRATSRGLRQQDSVLRLDRLVFAMDQKPVVYEHVAPVAKEGVPEREGPPTSFTYNVELQLRPRGIQEPEPKSGAGAPLSASRYPSIEATATSDKNSLAKSEVASQILQKIRAYQIKYPALFQLALPPAPSMSSSSEEHSPISLSPSPAASASSFRLDVPLPLPRGDAPRGGMGVWGMSY